MNCCTISTNLRYDRAEDQYRCIACGRWHDKTQALATINARVDKEGDAPETRLSPIKDAPRKGWEVKDPDDGSWKPAHIAGTTAEKPPQSVDTSIEDEMTLEQMYDEIALEFARREADSKAREQTIEDFVEEARKQAVEDAVKARDDPKTINHLMKEKGPWPFLGKGELRRHDKQQEAGCVQPLFEAGGFSISTRYCTTTRDLLVVVDCKDGNKTHRFEMGAALFLDRVADPVAQRLCEIAGNVYRRDRSRRL